MSGVTKTQKHALSVIRARKQGVQIVDGKPRCGWHFCSFSKRTVRELVRKGLLVRDEGFGESYSLSKEAP